MGGRLFGRSTGYFFLERGKLCTYVGARSDQVEKAQL